MASLEVVLEKTDKKFSDEEKTALAEKKNDMYVKSLESLDKSAVLDGVFDFITYLRNNGIRTAVGSASKNTPVILEKTNLADKFDAVSCGLDTQKSKPDPEVFLIAAKKLGIAPSECVVIEDSDAGIEAAKVWQKITVKLKFRYHLSVACIKLLQCSGGNYDGIYIN